MQTLAELGVDDINISLAAPDEYPDSSFGGNTLIPAGAYRFRLDAAELDLDDNGKPKVYGDSHAILLRKLTVVDGPYTGRTVTFQRVFTKPYQRKDATGAEQTVSGIGDLMRAFDSSLPLTTLNDITERLKRYESTGETFVAKIDWEAYDKAHYDTLIAQGQVDPNNKASVRTGRKRATVKRMVNFTPDGNGGFLPIATGPSGDKLDARYSIVAFVPSHKS